MKKKTKRAPGQTTLTISLPEELKKSIEDAAASDQRSTSNFIVVELTKLCVGVAARCYRHAGKVESAQKEAMGRL
jgi:hypothetical protein